MRKTTGFMSCWVTGSVTRGRYGKQRWQRPTVEKITSLGATKSVEILPLIDWYTSHQDLKGEPGVSYLIKTDENSILFDVGFNPKQSDPSPLLQNMKQLGITIDEVQGNITGLKKRNPKVVGLSAHDSCDASIAAFRDAFSNDYKEVKVGQKIIIGSEE